MPENTNTPTTSAEDDSSPTTCSPRFIHDTSKHQDWGYIRDTKLNRLIHIVDHASMSRIKECRISGEDPHQKRIDELLNILNAPSF